MALSKLLCFFVYFAGQMSDGMANSFFKFKQFTIHQERSAMRVSTDGVLLGAWSRVEKSNRILDIGTGTGLIAIMAAQRSLARIDAVELDFGAASEAEVIFGISGRFTRTSYFYCFVVWILSGAVYLCFGYFG